MFRTVSAIAFLAISLTVQTDVTVRVETSLGNIDIAVDTTHAPVTAANFLKHVDGKFYDGGRFHRATRPDNYTPSLPDRPPIPRRRIFSSASTTSRPSISAAGGTRTARASPPLAGSSKAWTSCGASSSSRFPDKVSRRP